MPNYHPQITQLKNWKPGQSGNPGGKPKGPSLFKELLKELNQLEPETRKKRVAVVAQVLVDRAIAGDMGAQTLLWRYVEGNPTQPMDVSGEVSHTVAAVRSALELVS